MARAVRVADVDGAGDDDAAARDVRDESQVRVAYQLEEPLTLTNPTETGVYRVLTRPDGFRDCLVVLGPLSQEGRQPFCTAVDLQSRRWVNVQI